MTNPVLRLSVASLAALSLGTLAACSDTSGDEQGVSVEDVQEEDAAGHDTAESGHDTAAEIPEDWAYDGLYDGAFVDEFNSYEGQTVRLSAEVEEVLADQAFTIAGDGVEPLLVVGTDTAGLEEGTAVEVTGTVHTAFRIDEVEDRIGADLRDEKFREADEEPYLVAASLDTSVEESAD